MVANYHLMLTHNEAH